MTLAQQFQIGAGLIILIAFVAFWVWQLGPIVVEQCRGWLADDDVRLTVLDEPITDPKKLEAIARFELRILQQRHEPDPAVEWMVRANYAHARTLRVK